MQDDREIMNNSSGSDVTVCFYVNSFFVRTLFENES